MIIVRLYYIQQQGKTLNWDSCWRMAAILFCAHDGCERSQFNANRSNTENENERCLKKRKAIIQISYPLSSENIPTRPLRRK